MTANSQLSDLSVATNASINILKPKLTPVLFALLSKERHITIIEMKMLHWIYGVTHYDHVRNEDIHDGYIRKKLREEYLRWLYCHVIRR